MTVTGQKSSLAFSESLQLLVRAIECQPFPEARPLTPRAMERKLSWCVQSSPDHPHTSYSDVSNQDSSQPKSVFSGDSMFPYVEQRIN
jgi:hypothetical protein